MPRILFALATAAALAFVGAGPAAAHGENGDAIALTVNDRRIIGSAPILFTEIGLQDTSGDGLIDADEISAQESSIAPTLVKEVRRHVELDVDGQNPTIIGAGLATLNGDIPASRDVQIVFASGPHDGDISEVALRWSFTSPSEQVLLSDSGGAITGQIGADGTASFSLDAAATVRSFFVSGIDHIRFGLDHLLFLVVLTIAVVGTSVSRATTWRVVKLVTAFTLGHATSLCLAYFHVVSIPAAVVEPAISLSIVVAAVVALRGRGHEIRPWIAGGIGLVHGLGFASSLSQLGVASAHQVPALAAFNIGIDVAQTAVVLLVTSSLWASGRLLAERETWIRLVVCSLAGLVGLFWTISQLAA